MMSVRDRVLSQSKEGMIQRTNKTYNETWVTSKDSDQTVHPRSIARVLVYSSYVIIKDSDQTVHPPGMARVLVYSSLDSPEAVEGTCDQRRL